jgi:hypothetical protein
LSQLNTYFSNPTGLQNHLCYLIKCSEISKTLLQTCLSIKEYDLSHTVLSQIRGPEICILRYTLCMTFSQPYLKLKLTGKLLLLDKTSAALIYSFYSTCISSENCTNTTDCELFCPMCLFLFLFALSMHGDQAMGIHGFTY